MKFCRPKKYFSKNQNFWFFKKIFFRKIFFENRVMKKMSQKVFGSNFWTNEYFYLNPKAYEQAWRCLSFPLLDIKNGPVHKKLLSFSRPKKSKKSMENQWKFRNFEKFSNNSEISNFHGFPYSFFRKFVVSKKHFSFFDRFFSIKIFSMKKIRSHILTNIPKITLRKLCERPGAPKQNI